MGKLVALNTTKDKETPAQVVAQGKRGKLVRTGTSTAPTVFATSPVKANSGKKNDALISAIVATQKNSAASSPGSRHKTNRANQLRRAQSQVVADQIRKNNAERANKYSLGKGIASVAAKGVNQAAQGIANTLAFAEDVALSPFELLSGQQLGDLSDTGLFNKLSQRIKAEGQEAQEKYADNVAKGGKAAELFDKYGSATVAAVPQAVMAYLTAGASAGASTAGLGAQAAAEMSPSIAGTIRRGVTEMAKDPNYWASFSQVVGSSYDEALDNMSKTGTENNKARTKAALYAMGNGLLNAAVEVGGGIQKLPEELKHGAAAWKAWVESAVDEGKEEVVQGVIERAMQNGVYHKGNKLASLSDGDAILNPHTAAEEFAGGAVVGGVLGAGQVGVNAMLNAMNGRGNSAGTQQERAGVQEAASEGNFTPAQNVRAEGVQSAETGISPLQNTAGTDTMSKGAFSLKEELKSGRAREESRDNFLRRASGEGYGILEGDTIAYGYRSNKSVLGDETGARQIQKELGALGVNCEITDGTVLWNLNGISGVREIKEAVTVDGKTILINKNTDMPAKQVAGHEAFHLWKRSAAREAYIDAVEENLDYTSPAFQQYQSAISQAYLGGDADLSNAAQYNKLREELLAYISGDIHEGTNDEFLRPMFRNYDAVKAAWENLAGSQHGENYAPKNDGVGAASAKMLNSDYDKLQMNSRSFYPEGANAARPVDVPTRDAHGDPISKSASTVMGAKAIPDSMIAEIEQLTADRAFSYRSESDRHAIDRANSTIRSAGWEGALDRYRTAIKRGVVSKDIAVLGQTLLNNAANSGDSKTTAEILSLYSSMSVNTGQAMQAMSILRKMSPENQLYGVQKVVDNLNENVSKRKSRSTGGKNSAKTIPVEEWMDRVGEQLADGLARSAGISETKAQPLTKTILSDLRAFAKQYTETSPSGKNRRSEMDRISDLFHNQEHYQKALDAAKKTVAEKYGENTSVMQALDEWMQSTLDYTEAFTKEVTGQSEIKVSEELIRKFLSQTDQDGRDAVMKEIYQDVANQVPATWKDKWDAWRYLSMLANPRTHVRNIVGNMGFQPVRFAKDRVAGAIEEGLSKAGVKIERTKTAGTAWGKLWSEAWKDYSNVAGILDGSKFADASSEINDMRRIFRMDLFEKARKANSDALSAEDAIFKRWTYADTLSSYLKANGVTAEQFASGDVDTKLMEKARDYAGREAMRATYNDRNAFSDKVTEVARSFGALGEAVMPFKRTPANILARGFEYSPLGLGKSIYDGLTQIKSGKKSAAEVIDEAAAGLTGTALLTLGATLAAKGLVTGAGSDDNEDKWRDLLGHQDYALELPDGTSYTLDWLAPEALPFFMGVELMDAVGESGFSADSILTALKSVANPMLDMSMLQSLNDMIESVQYAESRPLPAIVSSAVVSYFTQAVPTLLGQIERTGEDIRMSTYSDRNSKIPKDLQYALGRASARIPGWDYNQIPYIDAWGEEEETGDVFTRAIQNTLSPGYTSKVEMDEVEQELSRIAEKTGDTNVYPKRVDRSFTVSGETKNLTGEEYVKYAKTTGQTRKQAVGALIKNNGYKRLSDEEKAEAVQRAYEYANTKGKMAVSDYTPTGFTKAAMNSVLPIDSYILYTINADRDKSGAVDSVESAQTLQELSGLTNSQRGSAWQQKNSTTKEAKNPFTGTLVKAGVSPETSIKVLAKYHELYKANGKAKDKTAEFKQYLRSLGFTPEQMAAAGETFAFYTSIAAKW